MSRFKDKSIRTVAFMMAATVLSKILGLVREMMLAAAYGAGNSTAEAFSAALSVPSTFFDILFSAAILGCFIPVYNSFRDNDEDADRFACIFLNATALLTGALALLGILFAGLVIRVVAPGLADPDLAVRIVRILFPMIIFTGMAYTLVGLMQSKGRFFLPALISSISNAGVIFYFLFLNRYFGIYGLAVAYGASWLIQFLTLAIPLANSGFRFRATLALRDPHFVMALKMVPPIMVGSWLSPMTILLGKHFASFSDGVAVFNYANQTYIMIAGILVYSICNYVFPTLSRLADSGDRAAFHTTVRTGTSTALFLIVPVTAAVIVLCGEGVSILYLRGEYTEQNAMDTAYALRLIALAMPAYGLIEIFSRVFYAKKQTRFPMIAAIGGVLVIGGVCAFCVHVLGFGIGAVALAVAIGQWCAAGVLIVSTVCTMRALFSRDFLISLGKILVCGGASFLVMELCYRLIGNQPYTAGLMVNVGVCALVFAAGAVCYLALAWLLRAFPKGGQSTL